jgi:hypothetical protein
MPSDFLSAIPYPGIAADAVLLVHASFVAFILGAQVAVLIGWARGWEWVRNAWFRGIHLALLVYVVVQTWLGAPCFLTTWEMALRREAGQWTYGESFVSYWIGQLLFLDLPWWVFQWSYTVFFALVVISWVHYPPRWPGR